MSELLRGARFLPSSSFLSSPAPCHPFPLAAAAEAAIKVAQTAASAAIKAAVSMGSDAAAVAAAQASDAQAARAAAADGAAVAAPSAEGGHSEVSVEEAEQAAADAKEKRIRQIVSSLMDLATGSGVTQVRRRGGGGGWLTKGPARNRGAS